MKKAPKEPWRQRLEEKNPPWYTKHPTELFEPDRRRLAREKKLAREKRSIEPPPGTPPEEVAEVLAKPQLEDRPEDYRTAPVAGPTMPLDVRMLADSVMQDPRRALVAHAKDVGMTINQARMALKRHDVREYMADMLDQSGATVAKSCEVIANALDAVKIVGTEGEGGKKKPIMAPDHEYRLRAAELSLKLRGLLANSENMEQPMTLSALIVQVQQERERRGLEGPPQ